MNIRASYDKIVDIARSHVLSYSKFKEPFEISGIKNIEINRTRKIMKKVIYFNNL